jgi:hypothetical protein
MEKLSRRTAAKSMQWITATLHAWTAIMLHRLQK